MLRNISKSQIEERIRFENPWWVTGRIDEDYRAMPRRLYFELFRPIAENTTVRRAIVLMGPRRVGKTVMLHHTIQHLIDSGVNPKKIIFVTIENPVYNNISPEQLFAHAREASGLQDKDGWYVILDEIQYCRDWELHLKTLVDSYRKDKFIVSGSAAAALKFASNESGAGRFTDFMLPPLTFNEYIRMKDLDSLVIPRAVEWNGQAAEVFTTVHHDELNRHFVDYINYGGYPEVMFSDTIKSDPGRYIRHDIVDKVLLRDLPSLYGIADSRELNALFTTIAYNSGNEFSLEALCKQSQVQKLTIKKYLEYLEAAYLIRIVRRVDHNGRHFQRDNFFKIYLTNPSLRSALFSPMATTDEMMGHMVETAIIAQWMHRPWFVPHYARWSNGEVDLVGMSKKLLPAWALEIKWSNRYFDHPGELRSLLRFCADNDIQTPVVTTISKEGMRDCNGTAIWFTSAASYAFTVGHNSLNAKMSSGDTEFPG